MKKEIRKQVREAELTNQLKHTWTIQGKGTLDNDSLLLKYGCLTFYGTETELDEHLMELNKNHSSFKVIGVHKDLEI